MEGSSTANRSNMRLKLHAFMSWFAERFPALNVLSAYLLFFFMYACSTKGEAFVVDMKIVLLPLGVLSHLLLLRILDEFKDHSYDREHHPDRVLQKGVLGLNDLKYLGGLAFCLQIVLNLVWGSILNPWWVAMTVWTALMTKEFFIGEWLRRRVFLYLISHMIVMVFLSLWMFSFLNVGVEIQALAVGIIFTGSVLYEISRKTRGLDEDERLDSYPKEIGFGANSLILLVLTALLFILKYQLLMRDGLSLHLVYLWDFLAALVFAFSIFYTWNKKSKKSRKVLEANYGGLMLAVYVSYILHASLWS